MSTVFLLAAFAIRSTLSCADHTGYQRGSLARRADVSDTNPSQITIDWAYDASYNWGAINPDYATCQTGTQQSPIPLSLVYGLSSHHQPTFTGYNKNITGTWGNWGYGPGYNLSHPENDYTTLPSLQWDNQTAYLKGWHIHSPADHSVNRDRSKAEIHLVHVDEKGHEVAVVAILMDAGNQPHPFFSQLPKMEPIKEPKKIENVSMVLEPLMASVYHLNEFWTYKGSLTSPPCMEGIRWFVGRHVAFISLEQMRAILAVSTYSAREEQKVWMHEINGA